MDSTIALLITICLSYLTLIAYIICNPISPVKLAIILLLLTALSLTAIVGDLTIAQIIRHSAFRYASQRLTLIHSTATTSDVSERSDSSWIDGPGWDLPSDNQHWRDNLDEIQSIPPQQLDPDLAGDHPIPTFVGLQ